MHGAAQTAKAQRRLTAYAPRHEGVDVAALLAQVDAAAAGVAAGSLELDPVDPDAFEGAVERHVQPPVAAEEEQ